MAKARPKSRAKSAPKSRPIHREWPSPWKELIAAYGGTAESLAEELGVSGMTIGRWADKLAEPNEPTKRTVNSMAAEKGIRKMPFP